VRPLVEKIVDEPLKKLKVGLYDGRDAKSALQERVQGAGRSSPRYYSVHTEGPDHKRSFVVEVRVEDEVLAQGRGSSKKLAEQDAARNALAALEASSTVTAGDPR
jgi:dsRNA-specific ribonuclease